MYCVQVYKYCVYVFMKSYNMAHSINDKYTIKYCVLQFVSFFFQVPI